MIGFYMSASGFYYEGDRANVADIFVSQRPSAFHFWNGSRWELNLAAYKSAAKMRINDDAGRRINATYPLARGAQNNMLARKSELDEVRITGGLLTQAEAAELQTLKDAWAWVASVRAAAKTAKAAVDAATDKAGVDVAVATVAWPTITPPEWPL